MSGETTQITFYADYVCPFCYLGRVSLEILQDEFDGEINIDWRPYDLYGILRGPNRKIGQSVRGGMDKDTLDEVTSNITRLQNEYGAEQMRNFDEIPADVDSYNAQLISWFVKTEYPDVWETFDERIVDALWIDGRDIGDQSVLMELAQDVDLNQKEVEEAFSDVAVRDRLETEFLQSLKAGVRSVPAFHVDDNSVEGPVSPERLAELIRGEQVE